MALAETQRPGSSSIYELKLSQSIRSLLVDIREKEEPPAHYIQDFYEIMQARVDPPLDSIWVYAALLFRSRQTPKTQPLDRIIAAQDFFRMVSACSASCGSSKSIALLAPVVCHLYRVMVDLEKTDKKATKKAKSLVEVILGYINICCGKDEEDGFPPKSITSFLDLVRLWMDNPSDSNVALESFLPLVNCEVRTMVSHGECEVGYLAAAVIVEVFLLKMCFHFRFGGSASREEMEEELRSWAVGSLTGFCSFYFFEILLRMLLEKTLPLTLILSSEDEIVLRKVVYDAIILCEYPFLNPEVIHLPVDRIKRLDITRLIVTHEAIEYFREHDDQRRSISYANAFSNSQLPTQIIKWLKKDETASKFSGSCPKALIKWLLNLEHQGIRVFDDGDLKYRAKMICNVSRKDFEQPGSKVGSKELGEDLVFWIDNKPEKEDEDEDVEKEDTDEDDEKAENDFMNAAFIAASHTMKSEDRWGRKRKDEAGNESKKKAKLTKHDSSLTSSSGSEVDNPPSHEDEDDSE